MSSTQNFGSDRSWAYNTEVDYWGTGASWRWPLTSGLVARPWRWAETHGRRVLALVAHVAPAHKELKSCFCLSEWWMIAPHGMKRVIKHFCTDSQWFNHHYKTDDLHLLQQKGFMIDCNSGLCHVSPNKSALQSKNLDIKAIPRTTATKVSVPFMGEFLYFYLFRGPNLFF